QKAPAAGAQRRGANRARSRRPARAGRDLRDRPADAAGPAPSRLRAAGPARRSPRDRARTRGARGDRSADGGDPRARGDCVSKRPLLVIDGDSLAHRAYHALPKTIRRSEGRPSNAIVGFTNFLLRLWDAEKPRAVLVGWDTLEVPTYRHEAFDSYQ